MWGTPFLFLVFFSAMSCIWFGYHEPRRLFYLFKPLTMVLICLTAILGGSDLSVYKMMIIAGLVCSLTGDIFLMLPADRFLFGLVAFLLAHLCYISAFTAVINAVNWWLPIPFIISGIMFYCYVFPGLGKQKLPVLTYFVVILVMVWLASEVWYQAPQIGSTMIFTGAILFAVSDIILAVNRFMNPFKPARALNLAAYFAAQWLIATSAGTLFL